MAAATLLKERNREMCGVQTMVSLVMFNSHVQKKVSNVCTELVIAFKRVIVYRYALDLTTSTSASAILPS